MATTIIKCTKCSQAYSVYTEARVVFQCKVCNAQVSFNGDRDDLLPGGAHMITDTPQPATPKPPVTTGTGKAKFTIWLVPSVGLFLICSFTQLTLDMTEWSTGCRAILSIGVVGWGIFVSAMKFD